jgi:hypothetical protein
MILGGEREGQPEAIKKVEYFSIAALRCRCSNRSAARTGFA